MSALARRLRGALVAVVALAISAGVALAGGSMPPQAVDGLATAGEAAGKVVPVGPAEAPEVDSEETEEPGEPDEPAELEELEEPAEPEEETSQDAHGATVSEAARSETPDGFGNHGAFVSCVARLAHGDPALDLTLVTPEACEALAPEAEEDAEAGLDAEDDAEAETQGDGEPIGRAKGAEARAAQGESAGQGRGRARGN